MNKSHMDIMFHCSVQRIFFRATGEWVGGGGTFQQRNNVPPFTPKPLTLCGLKCIQRHSIKLRISITDLSPYGRNEYQNQRIQDIRPLDLVDYRISGGILGKIVTVMNCLVVILSFPNLNNSLFFLVVRPLVYHIYYQVILFCLCILTSWIRIFFLYISAISCCTGLLFMPRCLSIYPYQGRPQDFIHGGGGGRFFRN